MALKAVVANLDEIPEALHAEYTEVDGVGFVLDVDDVNALPAVKGLKTAHDKNVKTLKETKTKLTEAEAKVAILPEDFDPEEYNTLREAAAGNPPAKVEERVEKAKQDAAKALQREQDKWAKEREQLENANKKLDGTLRTVMIDDGLTKALLDAGIDKVYLPAAKALIKESGAVKLVEVDDKFTVIADDGVDQDVPLKSFVDKWVANDGKPYVAKASGGDAKGGNGPSTAGKNPWTKGQENITEQETLIANNPNRAKQLASAAGVTPDW